jgi:hypothetical protein
MDPISSGFSLGPNSTLQWANPQSRQGPSKFCQQKSDSAVMSYCGTAPDGCVESQLVAVPQALAATTTPTAGSPSSGSSLFNNSLPRSQDCRIGTTKPATLTPNLANPSSQDVVNAVNTWLTDVCTVDSFLDNPVGGPTSLETCIAYAIDEPSQLGTLSAVRGLSQAGQDAAAALAANFPAVPANLYNLQNGTTTAAIATTIINFSRCCIVLPAIGVLVREAAAASGAFSNTTIPQPHFQNPCVNINCDSAASPGTL